VLFDWLLSRKFVHQPEFSFKKAILWGPKFYLSVMPKNSSSADPVVAAVSLPIKPKLRKYHGQIEGNEEI
jgi:hypothetical protein